MNPTTEPITPTAKKWNINMRNGIISIKAIIPNSDKLSTITPEGKNLIITGVNGCGKTQFINVIFEYLTKIIVHRHHASTEALTEQLRNNETYLKSLSPASQTYQDITSHIESLKIQITDSTYHPAKIQDLEKFIIDYHEKKAVLLKFDATRQASIRPNSASRSLKSLIDEATNFSETSSLFEEYLVSQKTAQAYAESPNIGNNPIEAKKISEWFDKLEIDLRNLFEDTSLRLLFDSSSQNFSISQNNKKPYRFQQLSSGYSSILSIYADLLTKVQLRATTPQDLYGIVFIDEIDAHLHVSLQRKILSFLTTSFPKIQFIASTHSPFVVASIDDAAIYDLSSLQQIDDLSMFSYESILSGLFNTNPVSEILQKKVTTLAKLIDSFPIDLPPIQALISEIGEHEIHLDEESSYFLKKAKLLINKYKRNK